MSVFAFPSSLALRMCVYIYIYINYFILPIILIIFFIYTCSIIIFQNMCFFPSLQGFFFQNNQIPQTISLVRKVLKLFRNLTKSSLLDSILLFEIESIRLVFCHWNRALQTRFQYSLSKNNSSSPTIKILLLQQIQANPKRLITKSTNPPDQRHDCGSDVDSKLRVGLNGPWRYCVRNGVVVHLRRCGVSLSSSLELAVWV